MSLSESKTLYDGFTTIKRGISSELSPSLIGVDQVAFAINTSFRSGYAENRPGLSQIVLTGDDFQLGRWQGAHAYVADNGQPSIVASIGGQIVRFDPIGKQATNLSASSGLTNPSNLPQVWMTQAENYLPIQDGSSIPLIWDGASLRRAIPVSFGGNELPVGKMMEYSNGRLAVVLPDQKSFELGSLAYSITGTPADVLDWTENLFLNGGGSFAMPSNAGFIRAMRTVALQDSTLGQGPLQVFGDTGTASIDAPFDRTLWQNMDSPIQSVSLMSSGPRSQDATVPVNGDLWYRSGDGVRSFMVARRDHGTWVNTPLSAEMSRILKRDDENLLNYASAVEFDNRLLVTVSPYRATVQTEEGRVVTVTQYGVAHRGLGVLDFNPVGSMFDRGQPSWDGLWTGLQILQILTVNCSGIVRCFIFALNSSYEIEMWELSKSARYDNISDAIDWTIETRAFGFKDQSEFLKQLARCERWFDQVSGVVTFDIDYRPDSFWGWLDLDTGSVCATTNLCTAPGCAPSSPQLQYRPRKISAAPEDDCEECVSKPYKNGFEFQFKLVMSGAARIRRFRAVATEIAENNDGGCLGEEDCCSESGCEYDPWSYSASN